MIPVEVIKAHYLALSLWGAVLFSRSTGLLEFDSISFTTTLAILLFFGAVFVGSGAGLYLANFSSKIRAPNLIYDESKIIRLSKIILFLQVAALFALSIKYSSLLLSNSLDLGLITQYRLERGREASVVGGALIGVVGFCLSGFFLLGFCFSYHYRSILGRYTRFFLQINLFLGMFVQSLGGGRFGLLISIFFILFFLILSGGSFRRFFTLGRLLFLIFLIGFMVAVFHAIFLNRFVGPEYNVHIALSVIEERLVSGVPTNFLRNNILNSDYSEVFFGVSMYLYYAGHSLSQLDVLLGFPESPYWPFLSQYQLYPLFSILNKLGFSFIEIGGVLSTLPISGVYSSAIGAGYIDFGFWGMFFSFMLIGFFGLLFSVNAIRKNKFGFLMLGSLYFVYLFFSPIVSVVNTSIFPSLIIASIFLVVFHPKARFANEN